MLPSGFTAFAFMVAESLKCHVNASVDLGKQNTHLTGAISRLEGETVSSRLLVIYVYVCIYIYHISIYD